MNRPNQDEYYLNIAKAVSARSTCIRRQYGAVIVKDNRIVSTGYNGAAITKLFSNQPVDLKNTYKNQERKRET